MHRLKSLGQRLSARDIDQQVAEIQMHVAILNGFTALSIPKTVTAAQFRLGERDAQPSADLCNKAGRTHQDFSEVNPKNCTIYRRIMSR